MTNNVMKDLNTARQFYMNDEYEDSMKLYEKCFEESPELFNQSHRTFYAWAIYQCRIKRYNDDDEFFASAIFITELLAQENLTKVKACPYTFTVFKVYDCLVKQNDYYTLTSWLDKINPDLLDETRISYDNITYRSRKEKYFDYASKAYLMSQNYEQCIEVSEKALNTLEVFTNYSDTWHRWRIAKSLKELGSYEEALKYLCEVSKVKKNWFVYKEMAENYYRLDMYDESLENISKAMLTKDSVNVKVNLYELGYEILKNTNPEMAKKHHELHLLLKDNEVDDELVSQIDDFWVEYKFKNSEINHGTITRYFEEKGYGFITTADNKSIFFHKDDFNGDNLTTGIYVSFYLENSYDKSKNEESVKAAYINTVI